MATGYVAALIQRVIDCSVATTWDDSVIEWTIIDLEEDPKGQGVCVCGHPNLVQMFTIRNLRNGNELYPIGNECVKKFRRKDMKSDAALLTALYKLRTAINLGQATLTSTYFSRTLIKDLKDKGAFTKDKWNSDGRYQFILDMFNKKNKDEITGPQQYKINKLLENKIFPFVVDDDRLR